MLLTEQANKPNMYTVDISSLTMSDATLTTSTELPNLPTASMPIQAKRYEAWSETTNSLMLTSDENLRRKREQVTSTSLFSHTAEQRFQKQRRIAESYIHHFIIRYVSYNTPGYAFVLFANMYFYINFMLYRFTLILVFC